MKITTYTPSPGKRNPVAQLKCMLADAWKSRHLALRLAIRDISAMYRQTFLGYLWALLPVIIITVTFTLLQNRKILEIQQTEIPYAPFVFLGMTIWQLFADSVQMPIRLLSENRTAITKLNFLHEAIFMSGLVQIGFGFMIRFIVLFGVLIYFNISINVIGIIPFLSYCSVIVVLGTAIGILLSPISLLYRDIQYGMTLVLTFWLLLTPVVYPASNNGIFGTNLPLNPVSPLLISARAILIGGNTASMASIVSVTIIALAVFFVAWYIYRTAIPILAERLGS